MFRNLFRLLVVVFVVALTRYVIGLLAQAFSPAKPPDRTPRAEIPTHGELRKDPVCGTFVAVSTSVKKTVAGETVHFCSTACRDKYAVS